MGLKCWHIVAESWKGKINRSGNLVSISNFNEARGEFTYGCQCDKSVVNRYCVVPAFEVCEKQGREKDENHDSWQQVHSNLPNQIHPWRHPVVICWSLILLIAIIKPHELQCKSFTMTRIILIQDNFFVITNGKSLLFLYSSPGRHLQFYRKIRPCKRTELHGQEYLKEGERETRNALLFVCHLPQLSALFCFSWNECEKKTFTYRLERKKS